MSTVTEKKTKCRAYSGKMLLRLGEDLHTRLARGAEREEGVLGVRVSINEFAKKLLEEGLASREKGR